MSLENHTINGGEQSEVMPDDQMGDLLINVFDFIEKEDPILSVETAKSYIKALEDKVKDYESRGLKEKARYLKRKGYIRALNAMIAQGGIMVRLENLANKLYENHEETVYDRRFSETFYTDIENVLSNEQPTLDDINFLEYAGKVLKEIREKISPDLDLESITPYRWSDIDDLSQKINLYLTKHREF